MLLINNMTDKKRYIPIVLGTARESRESEKVAKFMKEQAQDFGFETEIIDVRDYRWGETVPAWIEDKRTAPWQDIVSRADGLVVVCPEYNHGYPGELKILLDGAYKEYAEKPIGLCGVSNGTIDGARVVENLRPVLIALNAVPINYAMYFGAVADLFEGGTLKNPQEYKEQARGMFEQMALYFK